MKIGTIAAASFALVWAAPSLAGTTEQQGSYREAVLCSGLLGASAVYLGNTGNPSDKDKENIALLENLQKRWVTRAISLAPDAGRVMGDVGERSRYYVDQFDQLARAGNDEIETKLGPDMDRCLSGGSSLPDAS